MGVDAQGNTDPNAQVDTEVLTHPGYADEWFDLQTKSVARG
jgi:hypothetical protein